MKRQIPKKIITLALALVSVFSTAFAVSADNNTGLSYTYWKYNDSKTAVESREMFTYKTALYGSSLNIGSFASLADIDVSADGTVYIVDKDNNRVVVLDESLNYRQSIKEITFGEESVALNSPQGIYTADNKIYIADTGNSSVEICDKSGVGLGRISKPESDLLPKDFQFKPTRVLTDSKGYVYVLSEGCYYGALLFTPELEFCSFYGANTTNGSVANAFSKIKNKLFGSTEKQSASLRKLPYQFNDFVVKNDFVYTVTRLVEVNGYNNSLGQIRKLNPGGTNVLYASVNGVHKASNTYKFQDEGYYRGENDTTHTVGNTETDFVGIAVDSAGFIYALDANYGKIFVYDAECNYVTVFGGGYGKGNAAGVFSDPTAIAVYGDKVYVSDAQNKSITVFEKNEYGNKVFSAEELTLNGNYSEAAGLWESVLSCDRANQLAYAGLSKYEYSRGDYKAAREYAKLGYSQNLYAKAQSKIRGEFISNNFFWIFPSVIILFVAIFLLSKVLNKSKFKFPRTVKNIFAAVVHPFDTFDQIRYYNGGSATVSTVLLILYYISSVMKEMYKGFAFHIFRAKEYNSGLTLLSSAGLILLWVFVGWLVCSLMNGKGTLKDIYIANGYCVTPLIAMNILLCALSNILLPEQQIVLSVIGILFTGYTLLMICIATMKIHEYNFFEFAGSGIVTVLGMTLVVFIVFMIFILGQEAISFVTTVVKELVTR